LDNAGNLLVADAGNQRVRLIGPTGIISTFAGNGSATFAGDGGVATNASMSDPTGVAVDRAGNVYIADFGNSRIRQVATNGDITTVAGNGNYYTSGDEGSATNASLNSPLRVAVDGLGNLFIGDEYEGLIRKVDTNSIITTLVNGLNHPAGMAVDAAENLFIADATNNRIAAVALLGAPDLDLDPVTTNNAGSYEVVISDVNGSVTSSVVNLTVEVPANIVTPPASMQIVVGNEANFAISAGGTPPLNYQWRFDGTNLDGATNSTLSFLAATTNLTGGYAVVVTNNYGSVTSTVAGLTVLFTPPSISWQTASEVAPSGSNATFAVVGSGTAPLSYQWYFNGVALAGQTNSGLTLTAVTTNQAGLYSAVVSSPYGLAASRNASLTVPGMPIITAQPVGQTVLAGGSVVLSIGVSGLGPLSFQWQCNGTNLPENLISTVAGNGTPELAGLGGPATAAGIPGPVALAVDGLGNLFFADGGNTIYQVDTNGIFTRMMTISNVLAYAVPSLATDPAGNLYIADAGEGRILKRDPAGNVTVVAGTRNYTFGGDGGPATNAGLYSPYGICLDTNGNLFIVDEGNVRVRKVDTNGIITTFAGTGGSGSEGDGGPATNAAFGFMFGVAADGSGNVFITDAGHLRKVDAAGTISTVATNVAFESYGIAVDANGDVYGSASPLSRVIMADPYGNVTTVAGTLGAGYNGDRMEATNARLYNPYGPALDNYGRLLIPDYSDFRVRRVAQGPSLMLNPVTATNAGSYTLVISSRFGSITSSVANLTVLLPPAITSPPANQTAGLERNATFTVTATGTQPLAYQWQMNGTNLVEKTNSTLALTAVQWSDAGSYAVVVTNLYGCVTSSMATLTVGVPPIFASQPGDQAALAGTNLVLGVAVTGDGWFRYQWQYDGTNLPAIITTVAGTNGSGFAGDGGPATSAKLNNPKGVAVDPSGNLFIADYANQRIRKVDTNGVITTAVGTGVASDGGNGGYATNATLSYPMGLTFDSAGNLYIAEHGGGDVRRVDANGKITRVAGTGTSGIAKDGGQATNTAFDSPVDVALDTAGNLYICEDAHAHIRKVGTNGMVSTVAGNTSGSGGGYSGDGGVATNAQLYLPNGVTVDPAGNVLVADARNYRVRKIDLNGIITTIAGTGADASNGDNQAATNAALYPFGLRCDALGNLFIADYLGRLREMDTKGIITTQAGRGFSGFTGDGGTATNAELYFPQAIAFDAPGNVYIADTANNRVRKVHLAGDSTLVVTNVSLAESGTYSVIVTSPFGSMVSSNFVLTVYTVPVFGAALANADGSVSLNLSSSPNISSRLYVATNLISPVTWQPVWTNTAGGAWQFTDTNTAEGPARFYRVSTP
jgi:sugar lactone lactonase YvrE